MKLGIKKIIITLMILTSSLFAMSEKSMTVYKSPYCGCCTAWIDLMKEKGFDVKVVLVDNVMNINKKLGISAQNSSCHTAITDSYVISGHVDYSAIKKMLKEKPNIKGLTVRGMPLGSPGMEQDGIIHPYNVLSINNDGSSDVYENHMNGKK